MTQPHVATREEWLAARQALLLEEKKLSRQSDAVAAQRRALPWVPVERDYRFEGTGGPTSLSDLFAGRSQLIVQHIMFHPDDDAACPVCSFWADGFGPMIQHMNQRDISFAAVSRAGIDQIDAYRTRMGFDFTWVSANANSFNYDFGVTATDDELAAGEMFYNFRQAPIRGHEQHGTSVFARAENGALFHTYSTYGRGLDAMNAAYAYIDLTPKGRDEGALPFSMAWVRRHDEYDS